MIKINSGEIFNIKFEHNDTYIIMKMKYNLPELEQYEVDRYILRKSITDNSFRDSNKKELDPEEGVKFTRIQCPSK